MNVEQTITVSPRVVALLLARLSKTKQTPVARAAEKHERAMRRAFMSAVREAQDAVPMGELEAALGMPGWGAAAYVLQPVVDMMLEPTERRSEVEPYVRAAAGKQTVAGVLGAAMGSGAGSSELCVLEETLYHGTSKAAANKIKNEGFKLSATRGEAGIFATPDKDLALNYAVNKTLNQASRVPLQNRIVALIEVKPENFVRRTTETSAIGAHLEWTSFTDVLPSNIKGVKLFRYKDVVVGGKVNHAAKPFKVLHRHDDDDLFVGVSHEELFANLEAD